MTRTVDALDPVPEAALEAAMHAYFGDSYDGRLLGCAVELGEEARESMRKALTAARSAMLDALGGGEVAVPVAWQWRSRIRGGAWDAWENGRYGEFELAPFMEIEERPLYARPQPAESLADRPCDTTAVVPHEAADGEKQATPPEPVAALVERARSRAANMRLDDALGIGGDRDDGLLDELASALTAMAEERDELRANRLIEEGPHLGLMPTDKRIFENRAGAVDEPETPLQNLRDMLSGCRVVARDLTVKSAKDAEKISDLNAMVLQYLQRAEQAEAERDRLAAALQWMRDRDERNGSLPQPYREKIDAALAGTAPAAGSPLVWNLPPSDARIFENRAGSVDEAAAPAAGGGLRPLPALGEEASKYREERGEQWSKVFDALRNYRMSNMAFEDDPHVAYPLVDLLSRSGDQVTIADGEWEMVAIADDIITALEATPAPAEAGPAPDDGAVVKFQHCAGCDGHECVEHCAYPGRAKEPT